MTNEYAGIAANTALKVKAEIKSFRQASDFLGGEMSRLLGSNVHVRRRSDRSIAVVLYETEIVVYHADETFTVFNGGFNTPTTSSRVNQFTPDAYNFFHQDKQLSRSGEKGSAEGKLFPVKEQTPEERLLELEQSKNLSEAERDERERLRAGNWRDE